MKKHRLMNHQKYFRTYKDEVFCQFVFFALCVYAYRVIECCTGLRTACHLAEGVEHRRYPHLVVHFGGYGGPHSHSNDLDFTEELELLRPFGTYTVISNDMEDYFEKAGADAPEPHTAKVNYQM